MWLSVWVASNLSLLINTAVVKVFLHQDFYGSGAFSVPPDPHLGISFNVFQWGAPGIWVGWCFIVWGFPILCRKCGFPVLSIRCQSCPSVIYDNPESPVVWEAKVWLGLHIAHWFRSWFLRLVRVPQRKISTGLVSKGSHALIRTQAASLSLSPTSLPRVSGFGFWLIDSTSYCSLPSFNFPPTKSPPAPSLMKPTYRSLSSQHSPKRHSTAYGLRSQAQNYETTRVWVLPGPPSDCVTWGKDSLWGLERHIFSFVRWNDSISKTSSWGFI